MCQCVPAHKLRRRRTLCLVAVVTIYVVLGFVFSDGAPQRLVTASAHHHAPPLMPVGAPLPPLCLSSSEVRTRARNVLEHLASRRMDGTCSGGFADIVCDERTFWGGAVPSHAHLLPRVAGAVAADASARSRMTPWLRVGNISFASNDYADHVLHELFFSDPVWMDRGTFLETGASTGVHASTTLFYERYLGWHGVLIEPTPCAVCEVPVNRRGALAVHAALVERGGPTALDVSAMSLFCPAPHSECAEVGKNPWTVRSAPLQALMAELNVSSVDFFSLDVEGAGETVLQSIVWADRMGSSSSWVGGDKSGFAPRVVLFEARHEQLSTDILERAGYTVAHTGDVFAADLLAWRNDAGCLLDGSVGAPSIARPSAS